MNDYKHIKKLSVALLLALGMQIAYASITFTGSNDDKLKGSKYSLKNLSAFHHSFSINTLKYGLHYTGSETFSQSTSNRNTLQFNSMMRYDMGNTTYIMPFKFKVTVSRFKTPSPNN